MKTVKDITHIERHTMIGSRASCYIAWSEMFDGPMNLVGREFHYDPIKDAPPYEIGDSERVHNRAAFLKKAFRLEATDTAVPKLTHSAIVQYANKHNPYLEGLIADGVITDVRNLAITMPFADCAPVVLFDPDTPLLTVLHVGWHGMAEGIIENAIRKNFQFGGHRSRLKAFIGPAVRRECYEVGPDVATMLDGLEHMGHVHMDIPDLIVARLVAQGVHLDNITMQEDCTCCTVDADDGRPIYYSYRRDKKRDPLDAQMLVAVMR